MSSRIGRAGRGLFFVCLALAGWISPPVAQARQEGAIADGRGGVVALAAGDVSTCAIRRDGTVACWGDDGQGPLQPPQGHFTALTAGRTHACGLRDDGRAFCWGVDAPQPPDEEWLEFTAISSSNRYACGISHGGQLWCWGETPFVVESSGSRLVAISAGQYHACGLRGDGTAQCWGQNSYGQASPPPGAFIALSAGWERTCGLRIDGSIECWGYVGYGPQPPAGPFDALTLGAGHACGLRHDGSVECWGYGGQATPPPGRFTAISAGMDHTCGLRSDGRIECWGASFAGQTASPNDVFGVGSLAAGWSHTCQVRADGTLACWGQNDAGQLDAPEAQWWEAPWRFVEVASGSKDNCARRDDGSTFCWGSNENGASTPPPNGGLHGFDVGWTHGCALGSDGMATCWGWNENGQATPPQDAFRSVTAGFVHSCGVRADGTATCWGYDGNGQNTPPPPPYGEWGMSMLALEAGDLGGCALFDNNTLNCTGFYYGSGEQTRLSGVRAFSSNDVHACAILINGELACAGYNAVGQAVPPPGRYVSVASGLEHSCAIRSDGARVCWGDDSRGQYPHLELYPRDIWPMGVDQPVLLPLQLYRWTSGGGADYGSVAGTYTVTWGSLPPGLFLDANGQLSGTPTTPGLYPVIFEGRDEDGFTAQAYLIFRIDGTPPQITEKVTGTLGDNGWYVDDVEITWLLDDAESWVFVSGGCDWTVLGNDSAAAGFSCTAESAGGSDTKTITLKRDATAPETTLTSTPGAGTISGHAVFAFGGNDATSGVSRYECSVDNTAYATCASPMAVDVATGVHHFAVRAIDMAGNRDASPALHTWQFDPTPPQIVPIVTGVLGSNGWYASNVQVSWNTSDAGSAITASTGCGTVVLASDTMGVDYTCSATSTGGTTSRTVSIKRDATAPTILANATTVPNAAGWYRSAVTVAFTCDDTTSGGVACPAAQLLDAEGAAVGTGPRTIHDAAGNPTTHPGVQVKIDRTAPTLAPVVGSGTLLLNSTVAPSANGSDALSGIASQSCAAPATGSVGNKSVACTVSDAAGNSATASASYRVVFGFDGFASPVSNTAALNQIKAGRSVPLRWRVLDANGAPVTNLGSASVTAATLTCPAGDINRITTYGGSSSQLQNLGNGYYQLDWPAPGNYRNSCRTLQLSIGDGEIHPVPFQFN